MISQRQMWIGFEMLTTVNGHDRKNNLFFTWVRSNYVTAVAAGIRVQSDLDTRSASLARFLHEMTRYPEAVTRERYLADRDATDASSSHWEWSNTAFEEIARPGDTHADPSVPGRDLESLLETAAPIRAYVNKVVAHRSARSFTGGLSPNDVSPALDLVRGLVQKYSSHIANVSIDSNIGFPAWWGIFREPWKEPHGIGDLFR